MEVLVAVLAILVAIAILYELARRLGVPFPTLMVLGGLGLAFVPGLPTIALEPELVLLVFLPPLLFSAAVATPRRDLRANLVPIARLSIGLVLFTMVCVAVVAYRAAVLAVVTGSFVLSDALVGFFVAAVGGVALGIIVGRGAVWLLARLDDPPVEV